MTDIWCECVGNTFIYQEYYRLIIRAHRFELSEILDIKLNIIKWIVITVGYYYFEQFAKKFMIPSKYGCCLHVERQYIRLKNLMMQFII